MLDNIIKYTNIPIKILKSIFLLIMSILKTFSSNYVPLLVVTFTIFYLFTFLSKRKLVLPCNDCENGSWWYKCKKNTGFGTKTCRDYTYISNISEDLYTLVKGGPDKLLKGLLMLLTHTTNVLKKSVQFFDETTKILSLLMPHWLLFKYIVKPVTKALFSGFDKVRNELDKFSCPFTIPIVNEKLDLCKSVVFLLKSQLKLIENAIETLLDIIDTIVSIIFSFLKKYVFSGLIKNISFTIKLITGNILNVFSKFGQLLNEIKKPFNVIFNIPFHKYFILVIDYIINIIIEYVPGASVIKNIPSIIIGIAVLPLILIIVVPLVGGTIAFFALIKSVVYAIFGVDDNDDFIFLFKYIFNFIINFFGNLFKNDT
jgi:hypothetical protein